jgi:hypothetical protein
VNFWKVILATAVIYGAGVMTGGLLVNQIRHPQPRSDNRQSGNGGSHPPGGPHGGPRPDNPGGFPRLRQPEILGDKFVQQLDDALKLTSDQRASIQKIIADGQERNRSIWTNNSTQMRGVIQDVRRRIRETLTPDQQKQFEVLMRHMPRRQNYTNSPSVAATNTLEHQAITIHEEHLRALAGGMPSPPVFPPTNAPAN